MKEDSSEDIFSLLEKQPRYRLHFDDLSHPASSSFLSLVNGGTVLQNSTKHVLRHLYKPCEEPKIPAIRSVTLVLRPMGGVAYTSGIPLDELHKEIHVSLDYIASLKEPLRCRDEIIGVCAHEMVHCWQHDCQGTAPGGLIEGIADFVRLRSGLAPPHWRGPKHEIGDRWDSGYQKTAYFLDWLEHTFGTGTIARMNQTMTSKYSEREFWTSLFGKEHEVDSLWKQYRESLAKDVDDTTSVKSVGSEPILIEMPSGDELLL